MCRIDKLNCLTSLIVIENLQDNKIQDYNWKWNEEIKSLQTEADLGFRVSGCQAEADHMIW